MWDHSIISADFFSQSCIAEVFAVVGTVPVNDITIFCASWFLSLYLNHSLTRLQTKGCIDSAIFIERSNRNNQKIEELRRELRQLQGPDEVSRVIDSIKLLLEFEPSVFKSMVQKIVVYPERFSFHRINGLEFA